MARMRGAYLICQSRVVHYGLCQRLDFLWCATHRCAILVCGWQLATLIVSHGLYAIERHLVALSGWRGFDGFDQCQRCICISRILERIVIDAHSTGPALIGLLGEVFRLAEFRLRLVEVRAPTGKCRPCGLAVRILAKHRMTEIAVFLQPIEECLPRLGIDR